MSTKFLTTTVTGLGYGDEGKGATVDWLCRHGGAQAVVRFSGGPQAGHNVVTPDGKHHCFHNFGSGMFNPEVKTVLSYKFLVDPWSILKEAEDLEALGVQDPLSRLIISNLAVWITPFHRSMNRIHSYVSSLASADAPSTCGMGIGMAQETRFNLGFDYSTLRSTSSDVPLHCLSSTQNYFRTKYASDLANEEARQNPLLEEDFKILLNPDSPTIILDWYKNEILPKLKACFDRFPLEELYNYEHVVFESSQGLLLDSTIGIDPYTTWASLIPSHAGGFLEKHRTSYYHHFGIVRTFLTRHGTGPFPTEVTDVHQATATDHNVTNSWQGRLRFGFMDFASLKAGLNHAARIGYRPDSLVVNHFDKYPAVPEYLYSSNEHKYSGMTYKKLIPFYANHSQWANLPETSVNVEGICDLFEQQLGIPVSVVGMGPTANDKYIYNHQKLPFFGSS